MCGSNPTVSATIPQMRIIALRGIPGAGKTTWAKSQVEPKTIVRVNKDDIRRMLCPNDDNDKGYEWHPILERLVCEIQDGVMMAALAAGYDVIVDNTHINPGHVEQLEELEQYADGQFGDVALEIRDVEITPEEAIERDKVREHPVGEALIRDMYEQLQEAKREV